MCCTQVRKITYFIFLGNIKNEKTFRSLFLSLWMLLLLALLKENKLSFWSVL